jgi:hypothetical protein
MYHKFQIYAILSCVCENSENSENSSILPYHDMLRLQYPPLPKKNKSTQPSFYFIVALMKKLA